MRCSWPVTLDPITFPLPRLWQGGGYGAMVIDNKVGPDGGQILVERTVKLINGMWELENAR